MKTCYIIIALELWFACPKQDLFIISFMHCRYMFFRG